MAYEFKKLSDVNSIEGMKENLNVLVEDSGEIVKIAANNMIPEDYIPAPATAIAGQTLIVKSVDENSKPTEWEAATITRVIPVLINDNTATGGSLQWSSNYSIHDVVGQLTNPTRYYVNIIRTISKTESEEFITKMQPCIGYDLLFVSQRAFLYFGEDYAPIILDGVNETITLDPDWVAPTPR